MAKKFETPKGLALSTPKGFRDFLPRVAAGRAFLLEKLILSLRKFGFEPLETPAIEFAETLKGKYGEEERLIFEFTDRGGRAVALRYDQTVPLARVVAANQSLPLPLKRYQVQPVWRADNPQRGRFREFLQVDFDIVGTSSLIADAEIITAAITATKEAGFANLLMKINDRETFRGLSPESIRSIDKLAKIGEMEVIEQLKREGYNNRQAKALLKKIKDSPPTKNIENLFRYLENLKVAKDLFSFDPTLARGLDYYTRTIFELEIEGYADGSVGAGGRYDNLIGIFANKKIPAVGFSFGFDRLLEAAERLELIPNYSPSSRVLVTIFNGKLLPQSLSLVTNLRNQGIAAEVALDADENLEKQLKYADNKGIPFAAILGPKELESGTITLKNLSEKTQSTSSFPQAIEKMKSA